MSATEVSTETEVANLALQRIGQAAISDIDTPGTDKSALAVKRIFADTRDEVCRSFPWTSITTRLALSLSTATGAGFTWEHTLTTPILYVLEVVNTTDGTPNINYRMEGTKLYTNLDAGAIRYVEKTETVASWDPLLLEAIALRLACKLAVFLTGNLNLALMMQREYMATLAIAMATKAIEEREDNQEIVKMLDKQFSTLLFGRETSQV